MYYGTYLVTFLKSSKKRKISVKTRLANRVDKMHIISYINNYYSRVGMIT